MFPASRGEGDLIDFNPMEDQLVSSWWQCEVCGGWRAAFFYTPK
jgi:hypothetical protein